MRNRKSHRTCKPVILFILGALPLLVGCPRNVWAQQPAGPGTHAAPAPTAAPPVLVTPAPVPKASLADLAWLAGRWRGEWGPRVAEQVWMAPQAGMMLGIFRLIEGDRTLVIELFTLVEKPEGISFYFRHFTPQLVPWEKADATLLNLASLDAKKVVFENPVNGEPKLATLIRLNADTYVSRSEIVPAQGEMQVIEIAYHREK